MKNKYPSYCCRNCGECIGWIGKIVEFFYLGLIKHKCKVERITIGYSDYSRKQIESGDCGLVFGTSRQSILDLILFYEKLDYLIIFKTNIFMRFFGISKYKLIAER